MTAPTADQPDPRRTPPGVPVVHADAAARQIGDLVAAASSAGVLTGPTLLGAVHMLAQIGRGVYEVLCTATEHAPPRAVNHLAGTAAAVGEHAQRLALLVADLAPPAIQVTDHAGRLVQRLHTTAHDGDAALAETARLLAYPAAAHAATAQILEAAAALRTSTDNPGAYAGLDVGLRGVVDRLCAAQQALASVPPPPTRAARTALTPQPEVVHGRNARRRVDPRTRFDTRPRGAGAAPPRRRR